MLTLDNLTCNRNGRTLFKNLSLTIGDCCLIVVKGANGSGKSSLLRIIATLLKPSSGQILYGNEAIDGEHFREYCDIIHYIGHKPALEAAMTVEENLNFLAALSENKSETVPAALHFFELEAVKDLALNKLSMGWQKRVILARLLLKKSEIWLLDEPYTYLDGRGKFLLDGLIQARIDQGGSVVIASNEPVMVNAMQYHLQLSDFLSNVDESEE
jgi:heme exporter protein A